jgi:hypothetical protein
VLGNPRGRVQGPADLPVGVVILPVNVSQEHQLRMKAVFITQSYVPVWKVRHACWMGGEVEVGMGTFTVHLVAQRAIGSPLKICVKKGKVVVSFRLHGPW